MKFDQELEERIILSLLALPNWILGIIGLLWATLVYVVVRYIVKSPYMEHLVFTWILSYDQHGNALAFGNPNEYISSRAGECSRKSGRRPCKVLCYILNKLSYNHCEQSIQSDLEEAEEQVKNAKG